MRQLVLALWVSIAVLLVTAAPVSACINDSDTVRTEREFKMNYEFKSGYQVQETTPTPAPSEVGPVAVSGAGLVLMLAAAGLVTFNVRRSH